MPTRTENAHRLAREARVCARSAHERQATGTKITHLYMEEIAQALGMHDVDGWTIRKAHRIAVDRTYEMNEMHLIDPADIPSLRLTAHDRIEIAAAELGWTASDDGMERVYRKKDHGHIRVYFVRTQVRSASTAQRGLRRYDRDKADAVIAYLRGDKNVPGLNVPGARSR